MEEEEREVYRTLSKSLLDEESNPLGKKKADQKKKDSKYMQTDKKCKKNDQNSKDRKK